MFLSMIALLLFFVTVLLTNMLKLLSMKPRMLICITISTRYTCAPYVRMYCFQLCMSSGFMPFGYIIKLYYHLHIAIYSYLCY